MELSDFVRTERTKKGWTQRLLAKTLGVSPSAVAQWELGSTKPSPANLIDLCNVFGISAQSFFAPGAPYHGHVVQDPEELALLTDYRRLTPPERTLFRRMLKNAGPVSERDVNEPEPARERN
ncbi:helix-turn-helix domain-containing protein [Pararoseomonas indoligenes]|uniref:Helix-turn-helix domain-containing protein n=1 Tax=Roseomonas indoligenes TaxID=2820811 RepID=A0A940N0K6_9PROT|nr:helix-turn-helix domain-containing protein [Pararoseomonas indoligenes]MBP0492112.1 helix-turn-helix domain-containing protein [Pararoseomonas indoligenes]